MQFKQGKKFIAFFLGLIMVVVLAKPAQPQVPSLSFISVLVPAGQVKFKKSHWSDFQPAFVGSILRSDDSLLVGSEAIVEVLCSNLSTWIPQPGRTSIVSEGCPSNGVNRFNSSNDGTPSERAVNNPNVPYIISPRDTKIRELRPTFKWNSVEGAERYTVRIIGTTSDVNWTTETSATEIVYSGESPLQPGSYYWLIVRSDNGFLSNSEGVFGFRLLDEEQEEALSEDIDELSNKQLEEEANALVLAHTYYSEGLEKDAIEVLEATIEEGKALVATYQLLGDIYKDVGLNRLAKERYLTGLELARAASDLTSQAEMEKSLVFVTSIIEGKEEAWKWLDKALVSYRAIGDEVEVGKLEEKRSQN